MERSPGFLLIVSILSLILLKTEDCSLAETELPKQASRIERSLASPDRGEALHPSNGLCRQTYTNSQVTSDRTEILFAGTH